MFSSFFCFILLLLVVPSSFAQSDSTKTLPKMLSEVVVRSVAAQTDMPFSVNLISKAELLLLQPNSDIPFLLSSQPSVVAFSDGGATMGYSGLRIRGNDLTRINVTINGIPYNDAESHGVFFVNLPDLVSVANDITVQRGVGVSAQGTSSFGGAIAINTLPQRKNTLNLAASYGSYETSRLSFDINQMMSSKWTIQGRFAWLKTAGYRERSSVDLLSSGLSIVFRPSDKFESSLVAFTGKEKTYLAWEGINQRQLGKNRKYNPLGLRTNQKPYENQTDNYTQTHIQWINNLNINVNLSIHSTTYFSKGDGYYEEYKEDQNLSTYKLISTSQPKQDVIRQLHLDNYLIGQQFLVSLKAHPKTKLSWGLSGSFYYGGHFGKAIYTSEFSSINHTYYDLPAEKYDIQSFVRGQWNNPSHSLFLYADLQARYINYHVNGFRDNPNIVHRIDYFLVNPKVGLSYFKSNSKVFASFSVGQREPIRGDFENNVENVPKPEILYNVETGYQWKSKQFIAELTAYGMFYNNQFINTGKINDVGAYTRENTPQSYRIGLEVETSIKLTEKLTLAGNASIAKSNINSYSTLVYNTTTQQNETFTFSNTPISFSPTITHFIQLKYQPTNNLYITFNNQYTDKQFLDNTGNELGSLSSYNVANISISHHSKISKTGTLYISLHLNNIFGKQYIHNGYTYSLIDNQELQYHNAYFPAAEFNTTLSVRLNLDSKL